MKNESVGFSTAALAAVLLVATSLHAGSKHEGATRFSLSDGNALELTDHRMKDVDGDRVSIQDVAGKKGTLVIFTCNACPWVKAWEDRIVELGNRFQRKGIGVIAINSNDPNRVAEDGYDVMKERAEEKGVRFPYVVDETSDVARAFGATRTPEAFLFDADGDLVYHGTIDDNAKDASAVEEPYLKNALTAVARGKQVPMAKTKALGCSIKFRPAS